MGKVFNSRVWWGLFVPFQICSRIICFSFHSSAGMHSFRSYCKLIFFIVTSLKLMGQTSETGELFSSVENMFVQVIRGIILNPSNAVLFVLGIFKYHLPLFLYNLVLK